jgi:hypothetical protein
MNLYDTDTRAALCAALDCSAYRDESHRAKIDAQANLNGRTPYVTDSTLRYHHARVTDSRVMESGCFYLIVERVALDPHNTRRGSRVVLFDLTGHALYRPSLDQCRATSRAAIADYYRWRETFDPIAHYAQLLAEYVTRAEYDAQRVRAIAVQFASASAA